MIDGYCNGAAPAANVPLAMSTVSTGGRPHGDFLVECCQPFKLVDVQPESNSPGKPRRTKADFRFRDARLCFSFVATLGDRGKPESYERLVSPNDLGRWSVESGCLATPPRCFPPHLIRATALREAIYSAGKALAAKLPIDSEQIAVINSAAAIPPLVPELSIDSTKVTWAGTGIEAVLSSVARDFISLYGSPLRDRVKICQNASCGIPFVDTSRGGLRRWCSMTTCGALAKKRSYRSRQRLRPRPG
jgi:predicted RNA-binding Zn ribbon-like protein